MWRELACAPNAFHGSGVSVVSTDAARVSPPGWCAVVVLGEAAVVVTPPERPARLDRLLASTTDLSALTDARHVEEALGPLAGTLGPADLQYGTVRGTSDTDVVGPLSATDPIVQQLRATTPGEDLGEAGFEDDAMTAIFVALEGKHPVAMSGHRRWPGEVAHMGAVTTPAARNRGRGRRAAGAAAAFASDQGLLVQWRSLWSNDASRELGASLGLHHCGRQFSFRMAEENRTAATASA